MLQLFKLLLLMAILSVSSCISTPVGSMYETEDGGAVMGCQRMSFEILQGPTSCVTTTTGRYVISGNPIPPNKSPCLLLLGDDHAYLYLGAYGTKHKILNKTGAEVRFDIRRFHLGD